jgi:hypothetical protein
MTFTLTYAGVPLCVPTPAVLAWVRRVLPAQALVVPGPVGWPASSLAGLGAFAAPPRRTGRVGSLYWPASASRCAVGHFLATTQQIDDLPADVGAGAPGDLVMQAGNDSVTASLYLLPPRPISVPPPSSAGMDQAFLCTFVDERYFWWRAITDDTLTVTDDATTWQDLIDALATLLDITITADTVDLGFGFAPNGLDLSGLPAAAVLDAVCYACGLRISRSLSGTIYARNADNDYAALAANLANAYPAAAGDAYRLDPDGLPAGVSTAEDQPLGLYATIRVVFDATDGFHVVDATTADQDDLLSNAPADGIRAWVTRRDTYDATEATDYVNEFCRDIGIRAISAVTRRYAGIVPWQPDGTSEAVEWRHTIAESATLIHPPPWSDGITELVGIPAAGGGGKCKATCLKVFPPSSLAATLDTTGGACNVNVTYDVDTYCGPICVSDGECGEAGSECTPKVEVFQAQLEAGGGALVGVPSSDGCTVDFATSPKQCVSGCVTKSSEPSEGAIEIVDTDYPFYLTIDPENCTDPPVWTYTPAYLSGSFTPTDAPALPDFATTATVKQNYVQLQPGLVGDTPTATKNYTRLQQAIDDSINPTSVNYKADIILPPDPGDGRFHYVSQAATVTSLHSGLKIRGASRSQSTTLLGTEPTLQCALSLANGENDDTVGPVRFGGTAGTSDIHFILGPEATQPGGGSVGGFRVGDVLIGFQHNTTQNRNVNQFVAYIKAVNPWATDPTRIELTLDRPVDGTPSTVQCRWLHDALICASVSGANVALEAPNPLVPVGPARDPSGFFSDTPTTGSRPGTGSTR